MKKTLAALLTMIVVIGCGGGTDTPDSGSDGIVSAFTFDNGLEGWEGGFAEYPSQTSEEAFAFRFEHTTLPEPLDVTQGAILLSAYNRSDDLFMYVLRKIEGLRSDTLYRVGIEVTFATNASDRSVGIGGSPGAAVYIKAGAIDHKPLRYVDARGWYRLDIDKGNQSSGGEDMVVLGNFSNGTSEEVYVLKTLRTFEALTVRTDANGALWVIVGSDSGYEGQTSMYIDNIVVTLDEAE